MLNADAIFLLEFSVFEPIFISSRKNLGEGDPMVA
jgi:hypothetical protein